jgi:hypothetical protein
LQPLPTIIYLAELYHQAEKIWRIWDSHLYITRRDHHVVGNVGQWFTPIY